MLSLFFHRWERRLADVSKDRIVRPFEWGLDWLPPGANGHHADPQQRVKTYADDVLRDSHTWFTPPPTADYEVLPATADGSSLVRFPSALTTPAVTDPARPIGDPTATTSCPTRS